MYSFEFVFLLYDSLEQNYSKRKEEKYRINKREPKTFQNDNLKYNK